MNEVDPECDLEEEGLECISHIARACPRQLTCLDSVSCFFTVVAAIQSLLHLSCLGVTEPTRRKQVWGKGWMGGSET